MLLYILTWTCASRRNGVQLFISHLARWLRTRCFSEPTFRPSGATNHCKNAVIRGFSTFSRTCIFFLLSLSLLWSCLFFSSPLWLFPPLIFSEVWLLNFLPSFYSDVPWFSKIQPSSYWGTSISGNPSGPPSQWRCHVPQVGPTMTGCGCRSPCASCARWQRPGSARWNLELSKCDHVFFILVIIITLWWTNIAMENGHL